MSAFWKDAVSLNLLSKSWNWVNLSNVNPQAGGPRFIGGVRECDFLNLHKKLYFCSKLSGLLFVLVKVP